MDAMTVTIREGKVQFIHDDDLAELLDGLGPRRSVRASHVEMNDEGQWVPDMSPSGGPKLAPRSRRDDAIADEIVWIRENLNL